MEEKKVLERMQRLCVRSEQCSRDLLRKAMAALEGDREAASRIVASLKEDHFCDDGRYAAAYAREKASLQGWGAVKIRYMLRGKGISDALIGEALEQIDPGKASRKLEKLVAEKYRQLHGDPQWRPKLLKYALGRGYGYEEVEEAMENICQPRG